MTDSMEMVPPYSPGRQTRLIGLIAENVRPYANGLPLMNVVDKQRGY